MRTLKSRGRRAAHLGDLRHNLFEDRGLTFDLTGPSATFAAAASRSLATVARKGSSAFSVL
jgi:hypothetical protein